MGELNLLLAFAAGVLTILSPCVLPLVPIVLGSAAQAHRAGPLALAAGLVFAFTASGFLLATAGAAAGFDGEIVRVLGAILLVLAGFFLIVPVASDWLTRAATPLAAWANARQAGMARYGLIGQAAIGALLGLVWSPCVGPTLGAATALAAQGENLVAVFFTMAAFGLGIASVLLIIAFAARSMLARWRGRMMSAGGSGKRVLGGLLVAVGLMIFTGLDKIVEGVIVTNSPDWLIDASTAI